ncbi:hypothetical protein [Pleionea sp. CnH1-48]|uniref:hypothetical protein n=1 Tax=Pleionea sp. CnH1-48 TaxID=2954494 RepID=UPI00209815F8|nr:hypothetical protein [Pleionea sp. CnH1-48]MCO7225154.1 hypothetical protein [Pleionea sp. CnH1-48]
MMSNRLALLPMRHQLPIQAHILPLWILGAGLLLILIEQLSASHSYSGYSGNSLYALLAITSYYLLSIMGERQKWFRYLLLLAINISIYATTYSLYSYHFDPFFNPFPYYLLQAFNFICLILSYWEIRQGIRFKK